jgi:CheY-like chemotaxis protein
MFQEEEGSFTAKHDAKSILVVADDTDNRWVYTEILTPYHVRVVRNGPEALHFVTQIKPNLFILDYRLFGMNGIQLYDQLHATPGLEHIPAIIISSSTSKEAIHEIESRHLLRVMKPFYLDKLLYQSAS